MGMKDIRATGVCTSRFVGEPLGVADGHGATLGEPLREAVCAEAVGAIVLLGESKRRHLSGKRTGLAAACSAPGPAMLRRGMLGLIRAAVPCSVGTNDCGDLTTGLLPSALGPDSATSCSAPCPRMLRRDMVGVARTAADGGACLNDCGDAMSPASSTSLYLSSRYTR